MTAKVACIVEGHGEVHALPILLRRLSSWQQTGEYVSVDLPIRVARDRFINKEAEFKRYLALAIAKSGENGWVLVLLDADDDCPVELASSLSRRAIELFPHRRISFVLASREFESWYIAAANSLDGRRGFQFDALPRNGAESVRGAKEWMKRRMSGNAYSETTDQPAFASVMDLDEAFENSRSFRKLCTEWARG